jgi:uncharacterized damage-inducible protein DinB
MYTLNRLWKYNDWANKLLMKTLEDGGKEIPASCLRLLSHIVNTQTAWLNRVTGEKNMTTAWEEHTLDKCKQMHERTSAVMKDILDHKEEDLFKLFEYKNFAGQTYHSELYDILLQVLTHGVYHRAQIAQEMRRAGLEPILTDYIHFVRTEQAKPA